MFLYLCARAGRPSSFIFGSLRNDSNSLTNIGHLSLDQVQQQLFQFVLYDEAKMTRWAPHRQQQTQPVHVCFGISFQNFCWILFWIIFQSSVKLKPRLPSLAQGLAFLYKWEVASHYLMTLKKNVKEAARWGIRNEAYKHVKTTKTRLCNEYR